MGYLLADEIEVVDDLPFGVSEVAREPAYRE
jgi:hypothetical protein